MGLHVACVTEAQTNLVVRDQLSHSRGGWICPVNLDVLRQIVANDELHELVSRADFLVADGMPLLWAARIQGTPLPERVAGSSLILTLSTEVSRSGHSVYLLGGNHGVAQATGVRLQQTVPDFSLAGWYCPPFGFEDSHDEMTRIEQQLNAAQPDLIFVGLGFPKQDKLILKMMQVLPNAWFVSCGISFSFVVGEVHRAPRALQQLGLEWVHRLAQEPRRLAKRYLVQGLPFAARLFIVSIRRRVAG
jgi:N-acetylglucosaminyldiphosphoundecaprenol N-acetyl-beta-D-mannosaminyltransferase